MTRRSIVGLFFAASAVIAAAIPIPVDIDADGDTDFLISREGRENAGLFVWENGGTALQPMFRPPRRLADAVPHLSASLITGKLRLLSPGVEYIDLGVHGWQRTQILKVAQSPTIPSLWQLTDFNGDGHADLIVYSLKVEDSSARIFYGRANGTFADPFPLLVDGKLFTLHGLHSPHFANFDDDDDLDFLCASDDGGLIYYENRNTNSEPIYSAGKRLCDAEGNAWIIRNLSSVLPYDWDRDGFMDLLVETKQGDIGWMKHSARAKQGSPIFSSVSFFASHPNK